jgi:uncharacterized membrane protein
LLPERDPDAFLARVRESTLLPAPVDDELQVSTSLPTAFLAYVLWRAVETASCAFVAVGAVVALALLAEALH